MMQTKAILLCNHDLGKALGKSQEMSIEAPKTLEHLLDLAERGDNEAIKGFYELVLETDVFIPLKPGLFGPDENILTQERFMVVTHADKKIVPVFSSIEYLEHWGGYKENSAEKKFKTLMRIIMDDVWIYLNPNQEVGKEFSPWELEKLRQDGAHAVAEIMAELDAEVDFELEVNRNSDQFPALKKKIESVLEVHPEIKEAFLISFKKNENDAITPLFGMRHSGLSKEKLDIIVDEISVMSEYTDETVMPIEIIADLDDENSINRALFKDAYPFYVSE